MIPELCCNVWEYHENSRTFLTSKRPQKTLKLKGEDPLFGPMKGCHMGRKKKKIYWGNGMCWWDIFPLTWHPLIGPNMVSLFGPNRDPLPKWKCLSTKTEVYGSQTLMPTWCSTWYCSRFMGCIFLYWKRVKVQIKSLQNQNLSSTELVVGW